MAQKPVFLTPVEIPEYCFLSEAVAWIALGRVPSAHIVLERKTYAPKECRFYWAEMPDNFEPPGAFWGYDEAEFESVGLEVPDGYFRALDLYTENNLGSIEKSISQHEERSANAEKRNDRDEQSYWTELALSEFKKMNSLRKEKEMVEQVEEAFGRVLELGWAKLFQRIREGSVDLEAMDELAWEELFEEERYEEAAVFAKLNGNEVSLSAAWQLDRLHVAGRDYVCPRVLTSQICESLDTFNPTWTSVTTQRFGSFYRVSDAISAHRRRGRPLRVDWQEVERELLRLEEHGQLPDNKESCIFHLIAHCEQSLRRRVGRSTIQRNMRLQLARLYDQPG